MLGNNDFNKKGWINGKLAKSHVFLGQVCIAISKDNDLFAVRVEDNKLTLLDVEGMDTAPVDGSELKGHLDHLFYQVESTVVGYDVEIGDDKVSLTSLPILNKDNMKTTGNKELTVEDFSCAHSYDEEGYSLVVKDKASFSIRVFELTEAGWEEDTSTEQPADLRDGDYMMANSHEFLVLVDRHNSTNNVVQYEETVDKYEFY